VNRDLFDDELSDGIVEPGARLLRAFALSAEQAVLAALAAVTERAPFRHMLTPGGRRMSVAMTNCGQVGWVSDMRGYRYDAADPASGRPCRNSAG